MWLSPVMFHYGLCHMNIQEAPRVLPNSLKGWGVCYHVYVIGAHKRTHVGHRNMPNHCTSIYHEWMCVWVAALKVIGTRYTAQSVMRTCMLPRELIWEILVWHRTVVGLSCSYCEAHLKRATPLPAVRYTNYLLIIIIIVERFGLVKITYLTTLNHFLRQKLIQFSWGTIVTGVIFFWSICITLGVSTALGLIEDGQLQPCTAS